MNKRITGLILACALAGSTAQAVPGAWLFKQVVKNHKAIALIGAGFGGGIVASHKRVHEAVSRGLCTARSLIMRGLYLGKSYDEVADAVQRERDLRAQVPSQQAFLSQPTLQPSGASQSAGLGS